MMNLSIIIVNWNSLEFTKECLNSIAANLKDLQYEVIVIDNASQDESCRVIPEMFSWVRMVGSDRNLGFAGANNLGAKLASGKNLLFLNPDTLVIEDAIQRMVSRLDSGSEFGVVGCRLLNGDHTLQTSCVQPYPRITNQLLGIEAIRRRWPTLSMWRMDVLFTDTGKEIDEVEVVSGACLMVKRSVFESAGGFSTDYFMYAEEADLCCKINRAGCKIGYVRDATIVHFGGQSSKKRGDTFADVVMRESIFTFLRKFRGNTYAGIYRIGLFLSAGIRVFLFTPLLLMPKRVLDRDATSGGFMKWYKILRWTIHLENWASKLQVPPIAEVSQ